MLRFPNAKINIGLNIIEKRKDGYHNIETVFYPLTLSDALEVLPSNKGEFSFYQSGLQIDANVEDNLIVKAYRLLKDEFQLPSVEIYLHKVIPFGAGLGGGSSNASFMLKMLNELFSLDLSNENLKKYAAKIGADCPFFIKNKAVFATGIGNEFKGINLSLKGKYLVLVKPNLHISTAEAYSSIIPKFPSISLYDIIEKEPIENWKNLIKNDFEEVFFKKHPQTKKIKDELYELGAVYVSMSGSGASFYGIFNEQVEKESIDFKEYFTWTDYLL